MNPIKKVYIVLTAAAGSDFIFLSHLPSRARSKLPFNGSVVSLVPGSLIRHMMAETKKG